MQPIEFLSWMGEMEDALKVFSSDCNVSAMDLDSKRSVHALLGILCQRMDASRARTCVRRCNLAFALHARKVHPDGERYTFRKT